MGKECNKEGEWCTNNRADSKVVVNNGRTIQRVPADGEPATRVGLHHDGLLLRRSLTDILRGFGHIPHQVVGKHVNTKHDVTEGGVLGVSNSDEVDTESLGDLDAGVQGLCGREKDQA